MGTIVKTISTRNTVSETITGLLDQGSLYSNGHLSIYDVDGTRITWHDLSNPAFGSAVDGTCTAYLISDATASFDSTAYSFSFDDCDSSVIWTGYVTLNGQGGALQLESKILPLDSTVGITSAKYVVPS